MTLRLPSEFPDWLVTLVGGHFPRGDEDACRRNGYSWRAAGETCAELARQHKATATEIATAMTGATERAVAGHVDDVGEQLSNLAKFCHSLAQGWFDTADQIEGQKIVVIVNATSLLVLLPWSSLLPFAGQAAAIAKITDTRMAVAAGLETALSAVRAVGARGVAERSALRVMGRAAITPAASMGPGSVVRALSRQAGMAAAIGLAQGTAPGVIARAAIADEPGNEDLAMPWSEIGVSGAFGVIGGVVGFAASVLAYPAVAARFAPEAARSRLGGIARKTGQHLVLGAIGDAAGTVAALTTAALALDRPVTLQELLASSVSGALVGGLHEGVSGAFPGRHRYGHNTAVPGEGRVHRDDGHDARHLDRAPEPEPAPDWGSEQDAQRVFRQLARALHPDANLGRADDEIQYRRQLFQKVTEAWQGIDRGVDGRVDLAPLRSLQQEWDTRQRAASTPAEPRPTETTLMPQAAVRFGPADVPGEPSAGNPLPQAPAAAPHSTGPSVAALPTDAAPPAATPNRPAPVAVIHPTAEQPNPAAHSVTPATADSAGHTQISPPSATPEKPVPTPWSGSTPPTGAQPLQQLTPVADPGPGHPRQQPSAPDPTPAGSDGPAQASPSAATTEKPVPTPWSSSTAAMDSGGVAHPPMAVATGDMRATGPPPTPWTPAIGVPPTATIDARAHETRDRQRTLLFEAAEGELFHAEMAMGLPQATDPFAPVRAETLAHRLAALRAAGWSGRRADEVAALIDRASSVDREIQAAVRADARRMREIVHACATGRSSQAAWMNPQSRALEPVPCGPATALLVNLLFHGVRAGEPVMRMPGFAHEPETGPAGWSTDSAAWSYLLGGHAQYVGSGVAAHHRIAEMLSGDQDGPPSSAHDRTGVVRRAVVVTDAYTTDHRSDGAHTYVVAQLHDGRLYRLDLSGEDRPIPFDPATSGHNVVHSKVIVLDRRGDAVHPLSTDLAEPILPPAEAPARMPSLLGKQPADDDGNRPAATPDKRPADDAAPQPRDKTPLDDEEATPVVAERVEPEAAPRVVVDATERRWVGRLLSNPVAWLYTGSITSAAGSSAIMFATPLVTRQVTGSPQLAGWVLAAVDTAAILAALPAGYVADRFEQSRTILVSTAVGFTATGIAGVLVFSGLLGPVALTAAIGAAAMLSTGADIFARPSTLNFARRFTTDADAEKAVLKLGQAEGQGAGMIGRFIGPVLAGLREWAPFAANAASYLMNLITLRKVTRDFPPPAPLSTENAPKARLWGTVKAIVKDGFAAMWGDRYLRGLSLLAPISTAASSIQFLRTVEMIGAAGLSGLGAGVVFSAAGIGGIVGALLPRRLTERFTLKVLYPGAMLSWTVLTIPMALTTNPFVMAPCILVNGVIGVALNVEITGYMATTVREKYGRASSAVGLMMSAGSALGAAAGGYLLSAFGLAASGWAQCALLGSVALGAGILGLRTRHRTTGE